MKKTTLTAALALLLIGLIFCATSCKARGNDATNAAQGTEQPAIQVDEKTAAPEKNESGLPGGVRLVCLNIGKADCMLLLFGEQAYLIDTGYTQTYAALETALTQYGVTHLNGVFITHCHKDHDGGAYFLASSGGQTDAWYAPAIYFELDADGHPAETAAALRGQQVTWLNAGDVIDAGEGCTFTVLGPLTVNEDNENNNSLVMRFDSPDGSILFAGDMKEEEEYELLAANVFTACDVLKVGHHGDNKATTASMLEIVRPKAALILTDSAEEPDTPANATIKRLNAVGSAVYVSQDFHDAVLLTLKNGAASVEDVRWDGVPAIARGLTLEMNIDDDVITIRNDGTETVQLEGYLLYSLQGDEYVYLPEWALAPGESLTVGTKTTTADTDLKWDAKKVWSQKKRDVAVLYDPYGRGVARTNNGLEE